MKILTPHEWHAWCSERQISLTKKTGDVLRPDMTQRPFLEANFVYPKDSGQKVHLATHIIPLVAKEGETLILLANCDVWPSSQHLPLFTRFREAFGEHRTIIEAPGHLVNASETEDAISLVCMALFFFWDCYIISASGRSIISLSHDEMVSCSSSDLDMLDAITFLFSQRLGGDGS